MKYVKDYLYIQETRYRDRFQVYFAIDEKILDEKNSQTDDSATG